MKSLLIIGRSGNGKSSVGNTILKSPSFSTKGPSEEAEISFKKRSNTKFVVVDLSGLGDTGSDLAGDITDVISCVFKAMKSMADNDTVSTCDGQPIQPTVSTCDGQPIQPTVSTCDGQQIQPIVSTCDGKPILPTNGTDTQVKQTTSATRLTRNLYQDCGYHAVIFVLKYGVRFTKQEKDAVQMVKSILGEDIFKHWGILVFSYGDNFGSDQEDFEAWCKEQSGDVKELFEEVQYRCVIFDNKTDDNRKRKQIRELDKNINLLQNDRTYNFNIFHNACFVKYENVFKKFMKKFKELPSGIDMEAKRKLLDNEWIQLKAMLKGDLKLWSDVDEKIKENIFSSVYEVYINDRISVTEEWVRSLNLFKY